MTNETPPSFKQTLAAVGVFAFLACSVWAVGTGAAHYRLTQAETQLAKGYAALAFETLEPSRTQLTSTARGCQTLINIYSSAHRTERLEWATQACLEAGIQVTGPTAPERGLASPSNPEHPGLSPSTTPRTF